MKAVSFRPASTPVWAALVAASVLGLSSTAWAQQALVADQSEIRFTAKQLGVSVNGQFKKFAGDVQLDPQNLAGSSVKITVDTGSATMNNAEADANLPQPVWFNVAQFPQATFQSSRIEQLEAGKYQASGKLTVKGVSTDVVVPVSLSQSNGLTIATGTLPIERLTYKIGDGEWSDTSMVANEVQVQFKLTLSGVGAV
ncbi:Polyisoprenoid-binding protein YceI [Lampropedia hyalina DSM 16112]|jgi:polyisoprenoid-binding protein YceI|uniref:Polyisoprenoid-binding protein YceI n=1 Tax=Lampropedia hyalina DSM 16112 TaxID=1122156 RepID=A0A1M4SLG5_9BURK|nr:YceI family protein [Lampropedia hyalina]SHE32817.1 Polyisoprenoid-binding protein YceI [Lampropedia hyalina DSM 16112]